MNLSSWPTKISISIVLFCLTLVVGGRLGLSQTAAKKPATPPAKDVVRSGDIKGAMEQSQQLLDALRANNWVWDWNKVDRKLACLPDQIYHEDARRRDPNQGSFSHGDRHPEYDEVAFHCDLYVRTNLKIVKGKEGVTSPEGFFIVGWKDGHVSQVPVDQVRLYPINKTASIFVFPGMNEYSPKLQRAFFQN